VCADEAERSIEWLTLALPPYHISEGPYRDQGIIDPTLRLWQELLPEYRHRRTALNIPRMVIEEKRTRDAAGRWVNTCVPGVFKLPGTEAHRHWTRALYVEPAPVVALRRERWQSLGKPERVSVRALLAGGQVLGHMEARSYLGELDQVIAEGRQAGAVKPLGSTVGALATLLMAQRGRVDFAIVYPAEVHWFMRSQPGLIDEMLLLPITEKVQVQPVFSNCTRNEWGAAIVARMDRALADPQSHIRERIQQGYADWLSTEAIRRDFLARQQEYFGRERGD